MGQCKHRRHCWRNSLPLAQIELRSRYSCSGSGSVSLLQNFHFGEKIPGLAPADYRANYPGVDVLLGGVQAESLNTDWPVLARCACQRSERATLKPTEPPRKPHWIVRTHYRMRAASFAYACLFLSVFMSGRGYPVWFWALAGAQFLVAEFFVLAFQAVDAVNSL